MGNIELYCNEECLPCVFITSSLNNVVPGNPLYVDVTLKLRNDCLDHQRFYKGLMYLFISE